MNFLAKLVIWSVSFPIALLTLSVISVVEYVTIVFSMPTDLWQVINGNTLNESEDS